MLGAGSGTAIAQGTSAEAAPSPEAEVRLDDYSNAVYTFQYPRDWRITQELEENGATLLVLTTLGESTVSLTSFPAGREINIEQQTSKMARRWVSRFRERDIRNVRIEEIERYGIEGRKMTSKIRGLVDWKEYTHEYFFLENDDHSVFVHLSAPDSELNDGTQTAFNIMLKSLRLQP
jgi:cold shock CspA family protein